MLDIFRHWSQRFKVLSRRQKSPISSVFPSLIDLVAQKRELSISSEDKFSSVSCTKRDCEDLDSIEDRNSKSLRMCECSNCTVLPHLTECGICLEPLQGHDIESCRICSNVICGSCAPRLASCAFCRTGLPMQRNRALERLLGRLVLPCKNSRFGCEVLLDVDHRFLHETICNFSIIMCPQDLECCSWRGPATEIEFHMKKKHQFKPLHDRGVSFQIISFREKAQAKDGCQYRICLSCYDQLFFIKITVFNGMLKLSFTQLGYTKRIPVKSSLPEYGVLINIHGNCKNMTGILPFPKHFCETQKIDIMCQWLYSNVDDIDEKDLVKIDLIIKEVNNCS